MQFQTYVPKEFDDKIKSLLPKDISDKVISIYQKINATDFVAGKVITDGLINLFDLDTVNLKKVVNALELYSNRNIFLAAYFLKRVDVLSHYGVLDIFITFLNDLMKYSGRKASYSLYRIDDTLVLTTTDYVVKLIKTAHKLMPCLMWSSGVVVERAQVLYETFGPEKAIQIIELAAKLFPKRPSVLQYYFDWSSKLFNTFPMVKMGSFLQRLSREQSDEILRNQVHALSQLSKADILTLMGIKRRKIIVLSPQQIKKIQLETLSQENYKNVFIYPDISQDLYFSAIFRRWYTFTAPTKKNILNALAQKNYLLNFSNNRLIKESNAKIHKDHSAVWDNREWIYIGKKMSLRTVIEIVENLFTFQGKYFSVKPTQLKKKLALEYKEIKKNNFNIDSVRSIVMLCRKHTTNQEIVTILDSCIKYLNKDLLGFSRLYSNISVVAKIWDRDPWIDMARSDELFSCTFMGDYGDHSAPIYLYDNTLTFMDYYISGKRKGRAYLIISQDENKKDILFIDIFEGSNTLLRGKKRFELMIGAIIEYAKDLKINQVVFNGLIYYNDTPRMFMDRLKEFNFGKPYYQMITKKYDNNSMYKIAPFPKPPFLNAYKICSSTLADGIIINVKEFLRRSLSGL